MSILGIILIWISATIVLTAPFLLKYYLQCRKEREKRLKVAKAFAGYMKETWGIDV